ncbi:hypothetical protein [Alistipes indistinctus]|uniref:hypothetical protein n=1 Tax=Alistipes indistinctus TaxID=626932 RepID=UPI0015F1CB61|nr:hypothetical protein [Alistipes indistinctus]BCD55459.1 hypothetical protein AI2BBH_P570 [Alistipes indistinctus]
MGITEYRNIQQLSIIERMIAYHYWLSSFQYPNYMKNKATLQAFCVRLGLPCPQDIEYDDRGYRVNLNYLVTYMEQYGLCAMTGAELSCFLRTRFSEGVDGEPLTGYRMDRAIMFSIREAIAAGCHEVTYQTLVQRCVKTFLVFCCEDYRQAKSLRAFQRVAMRQRWMFLPDGRRVVF